MSDMDKHLHDLLEEADYFFEKAEYPYAIRLYKEILQFHPLYWDAWYQLGYSYMHSGQLFPAIEAFQKSLLIEAGDAEVLCQIGNCFSQLENFEEAERFFIQATHCLPNDGEVWYQLAYYYDSAGQYEKAQEAYRKAITVEGEQPHYWFGLGLSYFDAGSFEDSLDAFDRCLELDNQNEKAWVHRGLALEQLQRMPETMESFEQSLKINETDELALWNKARCLLQLGELDESLKQHDHLLTLYSTRAGYWNSLAIVLAEMERYQEAIDACEQALKVDPQYPAPWNNKGIIFEKLGLGREAVNAYDQALRLDASYQIAHLNRLQYFEEHEDWEEVLATLERIEMDHPQHELEANPPSLMLRKAQALFKLNRENEAIECYKTLLQRDDLGKYLEEAPLQASTWFKIAMISSRLRNYPLAILTYDKCIETDASYKKWYSSLLTKWWRLMEDGLSTTKGES